MKGMIRKLSHVFFLLAALIGSVSCSSESSNPEQPISHLHHQDWSEDVRVGLNCFMDDCARMKNAYVVFDFDNTTSIFDVEEQLAEMIRNNLTVRQAIDTYSSNFLKSYSGYHSK